MRNTETTSAWWASGWAHVGARAAAEPGAGLVVADEDTGVAPALAVLDPHRVALLEPMYGSALGLVGLVAHAPETNRCAANRPCERQTHGCERGRNPVRPGHSPARPGRRGRAASHPPGSGGQVLVGRARGGLSVGGRPGLDAAGDRGRGRRGRAHPVLRGADPQVPLRGDRPVPGSRASRPRPGYRDRDARGSRPDRGARPSPHHLDPATTNAVAIRVYEKVGFKPVGVMRRYERDANGDGWHDGLLNGATRGRSIAHPAVW